MKAPITLIPLMLLSALLTAAHSAQATPTGSIPGFCQVIPGANRWQGLGVGPGTTDDWETAANWTQGVPQDDDVCIPSGGQPRIDAGEEEHLRTLDVANGATVHVDEGGKLFLWGTSPRTRTRSCGGAAGSRSSAAPSAASPSSTSSAR